MTSGLKRGVLLFPLVAPVLLSACVSQSSYDALQAQYQQVQQQNAALSNQVAADKAQICRLQGAINTISHICRSQRCPITELEVGTQVERIGQMIRTDIPGLGQVAHDVAIVIWFHQTGEDQVDRINRRDIC